MNETAERIIRNLMQMIGAGGVVAAHFTESQWLAITSFVVVVISWVWKQIKQRQYKKAAKAEG